MLGVLACARVRAGRSSDVPAAPVEGCYALRPGPWEHNAILTRTLSASSIPRQLQLTGERLTGWDVLQSDTLPLRAVRIGPGAGVSAGVFTYWQVLRLGSDSIYVGAPLPMVGASLRLAPTLNGLGGTLTAFTDAIPPDGISEVTLPAALDRIACW
jgi:hypothetical protein